MLGKGVGIALVLVATVVPSGWAEQVLVASLIDDITYADIISTGSCYDGCVRHERAIAHVTGAPEVQQNDCELQTISPFDATTPEPGLLRALVYCEDTSGNLIEQGTRPCVFDVCVDFSYLAGEGDEEGQLSYEVQITRDSRPSAPHTIYVDLSVAIDPTETNTNAESCNYNGTCEVQNCGDEYSAVITMTDSYGDGWVGGVDGIYNTWALTDLSDDTVRTSGTLADNHESASITECLPDGEYMFNTSATAAFADDMGWGICNSHGLSGEGLKFTVANGICDGGAAEKIERATADETDDAEYSYCSLPAPENEDDYRTTACVHLSSGMKIEGVGLFYDDRCNSADMSGCGARSIPGCRLCFVNKDEWMSAYPDERVPDWEDCPCCVASMLQVDCATESGSSGPDKAVVIWVSVGIVGLIAIACCLSCAFGPTMVRFFRRMKKRRDAEDQLDLDSHVGTSAFPESPSGGMGGGGGGNTVHVAGLTQGTRDRGRSGHFPIPRFDSIRGRFDSGTYPSNGGGGGGGKGSVPIVTGDSGDLNKVTAEQANVLTTAQSTPSGLNVGGDMKANNAPRSTVLDDRLVAQGYMTTDVGRPLSAASSSTSRTGTGRPATDWGLAMSRDYPDLDGTNPYAVDNVMVETGTGSSSAARGRSSLVE